MRGAEKAVSVKLLPGAGGGRKAEGTRRSLEVGHGKIREVK